MPTNEKSSPTSFEFVQSRCTKPSGINRSATTRYAINMKGYIPMASADENHLIQLYYGTARRVTLESDINFAFGCRTKHPLSGYEICIRCGLLSILWMICRVRCLFSFTYLYPDVGRATAAVRNQQW